MAKYGKWIGGGLGWAFGGPLGALLGFMAGSFIDNLGNQVSGKATGQTGRYRTTAGDFELSLLVLSAAVIKADKQVKQSELDYVQRFLQQQFGPANASVMMGHLKTLLNREIPVKQVAEQIRYNMQHPMRLQLLHYMFGIAQADGHVHVAEVQMIQLIAGYLGISSVDFESIKAMFYKDAENAYRILEIKSTAGESEIKRAYRKMALKYHPDKVASLGESFQKAAKEKFQKVQEAYEQIKKDRGFN
jgi:DnaJ like chaperone protein